MKKRYECHYDVFKNTIDVTRANPTFKRVIIDFIKRTNIKYPLNGEPVYESRIEGIDNRFNFIHRLRIMGMRKVKDDTAYPDML